MSFVLESIAERSGRPPALAGGKTARVEELIAPAQLDGVATARQPRFASLGQAEPGEAPIGRDRPRAVRRVSRPKAD